MNFIVAVDSEWGIGYKGGLLAAVKADLANFRRLTLGKTVVYGSKTLLTFPGAKPLGNRTNIVLSKNPSFSPEGAAVAASIEELLSLTKNINPEDIFVIGGGSVYRQLLPYCGKGYVTKFDKSFEKDVYFPDLDKSDDWRMTSRGEKMLSDKATDSHESLGFWFTEYERTRPR